MTEEVRFRLQISELLAGESVTIVGSLESRAGTRIAGWTIAGASLIVGAVLAASLLQGSTQRGEQLEQAWTHVEPHSQVPHSSSHASPHAATVPGSAFSHASCQSAW